MIQPSAAVRSGERSPLNSSGAATGRRALGTMLILAALAGGCSEGVRWQFGTYPDVHAKSQKAGKLTFAYFRNWYLKECTDFEEQVLKDPEVLAETHAMTCVPLYFDYDRRLAESWGLDAPPAYVIVSPDGEVLAKDTSPIARDDLLASIRAARQKFADKAALPPPAEGSEAKSP